jgi:hypothetical protein
MRDLFLAVLRQAVVDARLGLSAATKARAGKKSARLRTEIASEAIAFLSIDCEDFIFICDCAGVCPRTYLTKVQKLLSRSAAELEGGARLKHLPFHYHKSRTRVRKKRKDCKKQ